jgi:SHS2 domain-containing protein
MQIMECKSTNINPHYGVFLFILLITLPCLSAMAHQEQRITLDLKNKSLKDVFHAIEEQAEIVIMYDMDIINDKEKVTINVRAKNLEDVLNKLLSGRSLRWNRKGNVFRLFIENTTVDGGVYEDSSISITGRVFDTEGMPLPGATVF